jgi:hypothetical protein
MSADGDRPDPIRVFRDNIRTATPAEIAASLLGIRDGRLKRFGIAGPDGTLWAEVSPAEAEPILDAEIRRRMEKSARSAGRGT